jgi:hypothetical protein
MSGRTGAAVFGWILVALGVVFFSTLLITSGDWGRALPFLGPLALGVILVLYAHSKR